MPGFCRVDDQATVYEQSVDNARQVSGAHLVHISRLLVGETARIVAFSAIGKGVDLNPATIQIQSTANFFTRQVYIAAKPVQATVEAISENVVDRHTLIRAQEWLGQWVFACPMVTRNGQVVGAFAFHHMDRLTEAEQAKCQAFVMQVTLTLEARCMAKLCEQTAHAVRRSRAAHIANEDRVRRHVSECLHGRVQTRLLLSWHRLGEAESLIGTDQSDLRLLIQQARALVEDVRETDVRQATQQLFPSLIQLGLVPAIKSLADHMAGSLDVTVLSSASFEDADRLLDNRLPESVRLALYRTVEEALDNVKRHTQASTVTIYLDLHKSKEVRVRIVDDGSGLEGTVQKGIGLGSVDARVRHLGGRWGLENNAEGTGACLWVHVPVAHADGCGEGVHDARQVDVDEDCI